MPKVLFQILTFSIFLTSIFISSEPAMSMGIEHDCLMVRIICKQCCSKRERREIEECAELCDANDDECKWWKKICYPETRSGCWNFAGKCEVN